MSKELRIEYTEDEIFNNTNDLSGKYYFEFGGKALNQLMSTFILKKYNIEFDKSNIPFTYKISNGIKELTIEEKGSFAYLINEVIL